MARSPEGPVVRGAAAGCIPGAGGVGQAGPRRRDSAWCLAAAPPLGRRSAVLAS